MKKVKLFSLVALSVAVVGVGSQLAETHLTVRNSNVVYAWDDDSNSGNQGNGNQGNSGGNGGNDRATSNQDTTNVNTVDRTDPNNISNQLKGYRPVKSEDIQNARQNSGWLTDIIGMAISLLIILTFAFTGFITAADLFYLYFPPVRKFLYSAGTDGTGGMTGMGGNGGGSTSFLNLQWVSDEAVAVSSMLGGSAQATGHGGGMMNGGFGGGFGGGYGGGFGAQPNDVQQKGGKSVIRVYLGKRVVALVLLGVASVLLFTSAFTDFGINAGGMILNILSVIQEKMSSINFGG